MPCAAAALPGTLPTWPCGLENRLELSQPELARVLRIPRWLLQRYMAKVFFTKGGLLKQHLSYLKQKKEVVSLACIKNATGREV